MRSPSCKPDGGDARRGGIELLCNGLFGRQQQREYEPEPRFHRAGLYRLRVADPDRGRGDRGAAGEQEGQEIRRSGGRGHEAYGLSRRVIDSAARDPAWHDALLFHQYFGGNSGAALGASHQTGWTGLVADLVVHLSRARENRAAS